MVKYKVIGVITFIFLAFICLSGFYIVYVNTHSSAFIPVNTLNDNYIGIVEGETYFEEISSGDIITKVNGTFQGEKFAEVWGILSGFDEVHVTTQSGEELVINPDKSTWLTFQYIFMITLSSIILTIASLTYLKRSYSQIVQLFYYFCVSISLAILSATPSSNGLSYARIFEIIFISAGCLLLTIIFTNFPTKMNNPTRIKVINISYSLIGLTLIAVLLLFLTKFSPIRSVIQLLLVSNIVYSAAVSILLLSLHYKVNNNKIKTQLNIIITSLIIGIAPVIVLSVLPNMFGELPYINFEYTLFTFIAFPAAMSYVLIKQNISSLSQLSSQIFRYTVSIFLTLCIMNSLVFFLQKINLLSYPLHLLLVLNIFTVLTFVLYSLIQTVQRLLFNSKKDIINDNHYLLDSLLKGEYVKETGKTICSVIQDLVDTTGSCIIWKDQHIAQVVYSTGSFKQKDVLSLYYNNYSTNLLLSLPFSAGGVEYGVLLIDAKKDGTSLSTHEKKLITKLHDSSFRLLKNASVLKQNQEILVSSNEKHNATKTMNQLLISAQEEEKRNISNWLHDEILQNIIWACNTLQVLEKSSNNGEMKQTCEKMIETIGTIREKCSELYPLMVEDIGLEKSLHSLIGKMEQTGPCIFLKFNTGRYILDDCYQIHIYRIVKELLNNIVKHAEAEAVYINITYYEDWMYCKVTDDGKGFQVPAHVTKMAEDNHLGLATIHRQIKVLNGTFEIDSTPHEGTAISFKIPVGSENDHGKNKSFAG
ncbi:sensor histidine kinase [Alteribacillus sp. HJP-4]|uniref:sensor histidine kinase n=1 Tax=Alteribacillus sp. HJP-4 TaxID=2775394 RepID=UPI0035CCD978